MATSSAPDESAAAKPLRIYLAGPVFTLAERRLNRQLAAALEEQLPGAAVILPQDFKYNERFNDARAFGHIYKCCLEAIDSAQLVLAWLDGPDADSGTSFEVGYAVAKNIPVIGIRTDFRLSQERGVNVMLSRACAAFVLRPSFDEDLPGLARNIVRAAKKWVKTA
jgi:nucleoside 2-deoxyribosyltransferase